MLRALLDNFLWIGDQKVQDDCGEQFLFPQRWTKVSAKYFRILTFPFHFACKLVICNEKDIYVPLQPVYHSIIQGWRRLHLHVRLCNRWALLRRLIKMENNQTFWPKILPSLSVPIEMPNFHQENNVNTHVISCKMNVIFNFNMSILENITLKLS